MVELLSPTEAEEGVIAASQLDDSIPSLPVPTPKTAPVRKTPRGPPFPPHPHPIWPPRKATTRRTTASPTPARRIWISPFPKSRRTSANPQSCASAPTTGWMSKSFPPGTSLDRGPRGRWIPPWPYRRGLRSRILGENDAHPDGDRPGPKAGRPRRLRRCRARPRSPVCPPPRRRSRQPPPSQPSSGEEALRIVETLVRSNALDVIVLDSVAALVTKQELDGEIGDATVGARPAS